MKKLISIILSVSLIISIVSIGFAEPYAIVNKDTIAFDKGQETALLSNAFLYETDKVYLYVPIEDVAAEFGFALGWDNE